MQPLQINYETIVQTLTLEGQDIKVYRIASLDRTIDHVIEALEKAGLQDIADEHCPYFGAIWTASYALIELMRLLAGKVQHTLELGCCLCLPSLVAAKYGAKVRLVDLHPDALPFIAKNYGLNGLETPPFLQRSYETLQPGDFAGHDLVMASDVLYDRPHATMLAACLAANLGATQVALITDPGRAYLETFVEAVLQSGLQLERRFLKVEKYDPTHQKPVHCLFVGRNAKAVEDLVSQQAQAFYKE
jgi:predicted nicotinamide N-methyase